MKALRIVGVVGGMAILALTTVKSGILQELNPANTLFYWPISLIDLITHLRYIAKLGLIEQVQLIAHVAALIVAFFLARGLNRVKLDWMILTFLFPYVIALLGMLPKRKSVKRGYGGVTRALISVNAALIIIIILGTLSFFYCGLTSYGGSYAASWAVKRYAHHDVGVIVGTLEGILVGAIATAVVAIGLTLLFALFSAIGPALGAIGSMPVFDSGGDLVGWIGGSPGTVNLSVPGIGCSVVQFGALPAALVAGAITGFALNSGRFVDPNELANRVGLITAIIGAIGGVVVGITLGFAAWRTDEKWPGALTGFVDGALIGFLLYGRWLEILTVAIVGGIVGWLLFLLTFVEER